MKNKINTKEKIIEVSLKLFSEKGYEATVMEEIAKNVGIKKASLYYYFPGKKEIFKEVFNSVIEDYKSFVTELCKIEENSSIKLKLKKIFREYVLYNKKSIKMSFWDRFYYFPPPELKEYIYQKTLETGGEFSKKLKEIFAEGIKRGEIQGNNVDFLAATYHYALDGLALSVNLYDEKTLEVEINKAIDLYLKQI